MKTVEEFKLFHFNSIANACDAKSVYNIELSMKLIKEIEHLIEEIKCIENEAINNESD